MTNEKPAIRNGARVWIQKGTYAGQQALVLHTTPEEEMA